MTRTSVGRLVAIAVIVGLISQLVLTFLYDRRALPVPVSAVTTVLLAGLSLVLWRLGLAVKRLIAGKNTRIDPIGAARILTLAKACSLGGSGLAGYFAAQTFIGVRHVSSPLYLEHAWIAGASLLTCLVLIGVALLVESWCEIPPDDKGPSAGLRSANPA